MRHVRVLLAALAGLVLLAGCGPVGTTPPPAPPPGPDLEGETVTFWAWTYTGDGDETVATVGFTLSSLGVDGSPVTITRQDGTQQVAVFEEPAVLTPYPAEVTLGPGVAAVTFLLTATLPKGSVLSCEVRRGTRDNPHAPLISGNSTRLDAQTNVLPVANAAVSCRYPA